MNTLAHHFTVFILAVIPYRVVYINQLPMTTRNKGKNATIESHTHILQSIFS